MVKEKIGDNATQFEIKVHSNSYTVSANSYYDGLFSMAESGYTLLAVVGYSITGADSTNAVPVKVYRSGASNMRYTIKNNSATARNQELYVYGLYVKD